MPTLVYRYFKWLCDLVGNPKNYPKGDYQNLLQKLFDRKFTWILPGDENRAIRGKRLRNDFGIYLSGECTVLEMLIGLAQDCETDIMQDDYEGNRTALWFWMMVDNLELSGMAGDDYDESWVDYVLDRFLNRKYDYYGRGSIFYVRNPRKDMRKVELWYQLNWYLCEHYSFDI